MKHTSPDSPDLARLQTANENIEAILSDINKQTQILEESQRILAIQSKIDASEVRP